ncbi:E3 ubiquitin-protein ligase rfwd3.L [Drosophila tropicalis]|uniref:E3 ubiquitin-protein ligase rfwd3.L n=1 Tax=Drosophila tropicalis TaxID=46794 RepID=UPI0035AB6EB1
MSNNNFESDGSDSEDSSNIEDQPRLRRLLWQGIISQNADSNSNDDEILTDNEAEVLDDQLQPNLEEQLPVERQGEEQVEELAEEQSEELAEVEEQREGEQIEGQREIRQEEQAENIEEQPQRIPVTLSPPTTSRRIVQDSNVIDLNTPSPAKKRKRLSKSNETSPTLNSQKSEATGAGPIDDDEDDGLTCPICLDSWEMSGDHRLVSLKCGHLYGESCIRRWLTESQRQSSTKVCPQCKAKAGFRDIRHLYAKRLQVIDTGLREELEVERRKTLSLTSELATVKLSHTMATKRLSSLQLDYDRLRELVRAGGVMGCRGAFSTDSDAKCIRSLANYRLYMEKNLEICREAGCRVLLYSQPHSMLIASQKSAQNLFPGFGVRFIDPPTFKPMHFMHTSSQIIRDMAFSESQHMLTVASRERKIKLFDVRSRLCSSMFEAHDKQLWSCALDRNEREHFIYAGDHRGGIYIYDVRFPANILSEFQADENFSPVIHIAAVPSGKTFTSGGFLVCQLTALTFYEYAQAAEAAIPTRLNIDGPLLSMHYDAIQDLLLICVRSNLNCPQSRYILAKLSKVDNTPVIIIKTSVYGSKATPVMTRPAQMAVENNTLIAGYLQDKKQLILHDVRREERVQTMAVNEVVYDICPLVTSQSDHYLAALTDNKCRIYKVNSSS